MKVYVCSEQGENMYVCTTESMAKAWLLDQIFDDAAGRNAWRERFDSEDPDAYDWDSCSAIDAFNICLEFTDYWLDICELHCPDDFQPVTTEERTFVPKPVGKIMRHI